MMLMTIILIAVIYLNIGLVFGLKVGSSGLLSLLSISVLWLPVSIIYIIMFVIALIRGEKFYL